MKLFFKLIFALILLLLIAIVGFAVMFNPNDYKDDISKLVKEQTGRELILKGDISLSLFPWIGIDLGAIEISNAKGFSQSPFAKMEHLQVRAKLWPLLEQRLEADTFVIEGLQLNLEKNKQGQSNWDDLTKTTPSTIDKPSTKSEPAQKKSNEKNPMALFALNGIEIKQAQLNWHDQQQKQKISVKNVYLNLGKLKPETKIPFSIRFHLQEKNIDAKISFESKIQFSSDFKQFSFYDTQLTSDLLPATLKKSLAPKFNSPLMQLNLQKQTFNSDSLNLSLNDLKLQIKVATTKILSEPQFNSHIILHSFNPRSLASDLNVSLPELTDKNTLKVMQAQLDVKGSLKNINISNLKMMLDQTTITGSAKIKPAPYNPTIKLAIDDINIDRYLPKPIAESSTAKNPTTHKAGPEAALIPIALLGAFNLDADFEIEKLQVKNTHWNDIHLASHSKNGHIKISPLTLQGYDSNIKSDFKIDVIKNNALLSGNVNVKEIKAGELLFDLTGYDKFKGKTSVTASFNTSGTKLSQLKQNLNGNLKLNLKDGTLRGFDLEHQEKVLSAQLKGKTPPKKPEPEETKIANLNATGIIKKGILTNRDLRASTPFSRFIGQGTVNIVKESVNYVASVKFTESKNIVVSTPFEKMNSIPLDIIIKGKFNDLSIEADFKKALTQLFNKELKIQEKKYKKDIEKKLKEEEKKIKKDIENELKKKLGDDLKNLFKF